MAMSSRQRLIREKQKAIHKVVSWFMDCMAKLPATDNEQTMKTVMDAAVKLAALSDGQVSLKLTEHSSTSTNPAGLNANPNTAMASGSRLLKQVNEVQSVEESTNDYTSALD